MTIALNPNDLYPRAFLKDVQDGLSALQKSIPPRWLYDKRGSELFDDITELPEYYVTRTELEVLRQYAPSFARLIGPKASVVEYGAGAAVKIRLLLDALIDPVEYVAVDISYAHLKSAARRIAADYPGLSVRPLEADFISGRIETDLLSGGPRVGFFPGSTIGNLSDDEIFGFLEEAHRLLGTGAYFLLGADLHKSPDVLIPAYDDAAGVTAAFNLNLLTRINRELAGTFDLAQFEHKAIWNEEKSRIEMHLKSLSDQVFSIAGREYTIGRGETIHTENSRKFRRATLEVMLEETGWAIRRWETDAKGYFAAILLQAT